MTDLPPGPAELQAIRRRLLPRGPVLDIHVHPLADLLPGRAADAAEDARCLLEMARRSGVTHLCLSSLGPGYPPDADMALCRRANDYALRLHERAPANIFPFCYVLPADPDAAVAEIDRCVRDHRMAGIKLWISQRANRPALDPILERAVAYDVPVLQHAWLKTGGNLPEESTPQDVAELARRHPRAHIIMAHLNGANPRGLEAIVSQPNVLVDTSGGDPEAGMVELAVSRLGAGRVVFGSDAPGRHFGVSLAKVLGANLSVAQKHQILWQNALSILPAWVGKQLVETEP